MAHFAEIDKDNKVIRVLVVPDNQEKRGQIYLSKDLDLGGTWIQTSYNDKIRKNYAGIGFEYDKERDAFIAPKPDNSIGFDEETCQWITPKPVVDETLPE